jgi:hypothetical protein
MPSICASILIYLPQPSSQEPKAGLKTRKGENEPGGTGRTSLNSHVRGSGKRGASNVEKGND